MSAISDVGVSFKLEGGNSFQQQMNSMQSAWKNFSDSFNKAPSSEQHMARITKSVEAMSSRVVAAARLAKGALIAIGTAKIGSGAFNWALGNKEVAETKAYNEWIMGGRLKEYDSVIAQIRDKHVVGMADLQKGIYQTDSAMSGKPFEQVTETLKTIPYYMQLTGKSFEDASKMIKGFYASFGDTLPLEKQKTYAKDTLAQLLEVARISKSDPQQVAEAVGRLGSMYSQLGMTQSQMFADVAGLTAKLGGKVDIASTALLAIYPRAGEAAEKLEKARYEQGWARGQAVDKFGRRSPNWGNLENLEEQAKLRNPAAMRDLHNMHAQSAIAGSDAAREAEMFVKRHDPAGLFKYLGEQVDANRSNPRMMKVLRDAFGQEHINAMLAMIDLHRNRENQRLRQGFDNLQGNSAMAQADQINEKDLNHLWGLVKQGAEALSASLRGIFYEPMKLLLEEWKGVFGKLEQEFAGKGGLQKLKEFSAAGMAGVRTGWNGGNPIPEDNRSVGQMFQEWISTLSADDWKQAGQKIGSAASDFVQIMGELKVVIHSLASLVGPLVKKENAIPVGLGYGLSKLGKTPAQKGALFGIGFVGGEVIKGAQLPQGGELDERGMVYPTPAAKPDRTADMLRRSGMVYPSPAAKPDRTADMLVPTHRRSGMVIPPDNLQTAHTPGKITYQPNNNIEVHVNLDGDEIAQKTAPRIKEEIKDEVTEELENWWSNKDGRSRGNAQDQGLF